MPQDKITNNGRYIDKDIVELARQIYLAGKNHKSNEDGLDIKSSAVLIDNLFKSRLKKICK